MTRLRHRLRHDMLRFTSSKYVYVVSKIHCVNKSLLIWQSGLNFEVQKLIVRRSWLLSKNVRRVDEYVNKETKRKCYLVYLSHHKCKTLLQQDVSSMTLHVFIKSSFQDPVSASCFRDINRLENKITCLYNVRLLDETWRFCVRPKCFVLRYRIRDPTL